MEINEFTIFQELFGNSVRVKILEFFLETDGVAFPIEALIEDKEIGKSQTYELVDDLVKRKYLLKDKVYKRKQYYKLNTKNAIIKDLRGLYKKLLLASF